MQSTEPVFEVSAQPMWYAASPDTVSADAHPVITRFVAACRARWPGEAFVIDVNVPGLRVDRYAAPPAPRPTWSPEWRRTGIDDVIGLCVLAAHPVLATTDAPLPHDGRPIFVRAQQPIRGLAWPDDAADGHAIVALARRADPDERLDQRRRTARGFGPGIQVASGPLPAWAADRSVQSLSGFRVIGTIPAFSQAQVAVEPVPERCHPTWLAEHGGPIGRAFARALPEAWRAPDADVFIHGRINELSPGFWPCLAGWHQDGTSRANKRADGTPDLLDLGRTVEQVACCVGPTGMTGFLVGHAALPITPLHMAPGVVGPVRQAILRDAVARGALSEVHAPPFTLVQFGYGDYHTCRPATGPGWRFFIKAMRGRGEPPRNGFVPRSQISWPVDCGSWPPDPLGVFPARLPPGVRDGAAQQ